MTAAEELTSSKQKFKKYFNSTTKEFSRRLFRGRISNAPNRELQEMPPV